MDDDANAIMWLVMIARNERGKPGREGIGSALEELIQTLKSKFSDEVVLVNALENIDSDTPWGYLGYYILFVEGLLKTNAYKDTDVLSASTLLVKALLPHFEADGEGFALATTVYIKAEIDKLTKLPNFEKADLTALFCRIFRC